MPAQPKALYLLWNASSDSGSVQAHPGLRWTCECSRVELPTAHASQAGTAMSSCRRNLLLFDVLKMLGDLPALVSVALEHLTLFKLFCRS